MNFLKNITNHNYHISQRPTLNSTGDIQCQSGTFDIRVQKDGGDKVEQLSE